MNKYGEVCTRKASQEKERQEHKNAQVLETAKEVLQQVVPDLDINDSTPIIDQLALLTKPINKPDIDVKQKFEERAEKKIQYKVTKKISQAMAVHKVTQSKFVNGIETIISEAIKIQQQLCTLDHFTTNISEKIKKFDQDLKDSANNLSTKKHALQMHYTKVFQNKRLRLDLKKKNRKSEDK